MIGICFFSAGRPTGLPRLAWAARNTGDSSIDSRMNRPISTSTADSRNGIRQPQDRNASSLCTSASNASSPLASNWPSGTPACGQLAQ